MEVLTSGIRRTAGTRARLPFVLPSLSGVRLNGAEVGRLLGVSRPTAAAYLRGLEEIGLLTRVTFFGGERRARLIAWEDPSPAASVLHALQAVRPDCRFSWWRRTRKREVPLVAHLEDERVGFCFSSASRPRRADWAPLAAAISRGVIGRGFLLHAGAHASRRHEAPIFCVPRDLFMAQVVHWLFTWREPKESWQAILRVNRAAPKGPGFP